MAARTLSVVPPLVEERPDPIPDDAPARRLAAVPRQLALDLPWEVAPGVPAVPPVPPGLRLVTDDTPAPGSDRALPDPARWTAQLARAIAEVGTGQRPPGQLTKWVAREELARLVMRGAAYRRHPAVRGQADPGAARTVRSVRVCPVAPGIVETSAVLVGPTRARAVALRLEAVGGHWLATAIAFG